MGPISNKNVGIEIQRDKKARGGVMRISKGALYHAERTKN